MRYSGFTRRDIQCINEQAAWTIDQEAVFSRLTTGRWHDIGIMTELRMSSARYYRTKREINEKIDRILRGNTV